MLASAQSGNKTFAVDDKYKGKEITPILNITGGSANGSYANGIANGYTGYSVGASASVSAKATYSETNHNVSVTAQCSCKGNTYGINGTTATSAGTGNLNYDIYIIVK